MNFIVCMESFFFLLVLGQTFVEISRCKTISMFFISYRWFQRESSSTFANRTCFGYNRQCSCTTTYSLEITFDKSMEYRIGYIRCNDTSKKKPKRKNNNSKESIFLGWTSRIYEYCCNTRSNGYASSCSCLSLWFEKTSEFHRCNR